jgi:hypothetical protein
MKGWIAVLGLLALTSWGCPRTPRRPTAASTPVVQAPRFGQYPRNTFNGFSAERSLPLFWRADANQNRQIDPDELVVLWGWGASRADFVDEQGHFTSAFEQAYQALGRPVIPEGLEGDEQRRRERLLEELRQGRPTLVETVLQTDEERAVVRQVEKAAALVERLHLRQKGVLGMEEELPSGDLLSRAVFHRNQGPFCAAPKTERDPDCSALPSRPKPRSGLYPAALQERADFCEHLAKQPNARALMDHFSVVRESPSKPGAFIAVPYTEAYREDMEAVSRELEAAANALTSAEEAAFKAYLLAAAKAFRDNKWEPADAAWAAMGPRNSRWYLRVGPDEVYHEPCAWKAGFHVSFARINPDSLVWQQRLEPVKADMEKALAELAGKPYKARTVRFKLPDFVDIVLNAGDSRPPHGATIGQSLPNWGKVADRGGRTVAMTNLYTDPDSRQVLERQMASLFCRATMDKVTTDPRPALMSTVLHEAAHNLGPSHEYKVRGKVDDDLFGGPLASTLEELKAQTAAMYFTGWLVDRGILTEEEAEQAHLRDVAWAFGHIAQGMYTADGKPKNYSQLASIILGALHREGVLSWVGEEQAANGTDPGCLQIDLGRRKPVIEALGREVLGIKARGDRALAEKLKADLVDAEGPWTDLHRVITERWLRAPKATFVYGIRE